MPLALGTAYRNAAGTLDVRVVEHPAYRGRPTEARYYVEVSPAGAGRWQRVGYANRFEQAVRMLGQYLELTTRPR